MTSFVFTWDATFEAAPQDTENANLGAGRIRDLKSAVSERALVEHYWGPSADANAGVHKFPYDTVANRPAAGLQGRLFINEDKNTIDFDDGAAWNVVGLEKDTVALFHQAVAPTGWTRDVTSTYHDVGLRINTTGSPGSGGTKDFTTLFASPYASNAGGSGGTGVASADISVNVAATGLTVNGHVLTIAELPSHDHDIDGLGINNSGSHIGTTNLSTLGRKTGLTGSDQAHSHTVTDPTHAHTITQNAHAHGLASHTHGIAMDLKYVDVIRCTKV
jgi:hypothetical protein